MRACTGIETHVCVGSFSRASKQVGEPPVEYALASQGAGKGKAASSGKGKGGGAEAGAPMAASRCACCCSYMHVAPAHPVLGRAPCVQGLQTRACTTSSMPGTYLGACWAAESGN